MTETARVRSREVTLGPNARSLAERWGIRESDLRLARAISISTYEQPTYLIAIGQLPDGRRIRMRCLHALPAHIIDMRLV